MHKECPACGGTKLKHNHERFESTCTECGLILPDRAESMGKLSEHRLTKRDISSKIEGVHKAVDLLNKKVDKICSVIGLGLSDLRENSFGPFALNDPLTRYVVGYIAQVGRPVSVKKVVEEGGWVKDLEEVERVRKNYGLAKRIRIYMNEMARKGVIVARGKRKKRYDLSCWVAPFHEELKNYFVKNSSNPPEP